MLDAAFEWVARIFLGVLCCGDLCRGGNLRANLWHEPAAEPKPGLTLSCLSLPAFVPAVGFFGRLSCSQIFEGGGMGCSASPLCQSILAEMLILMLRIGPHQSSDDGFLWCDISQPKKERHIDRQPACEF